MFCSLFLKSFLRRNSGISANRPILHALLQFYTPETIPLKVVTPGSYSTKFVMSPRHRNNRKAKSFFARYYFDRTMGARQSCKHFKNFETMIRHPDEWQPRLALFSLTRIHLKEILSPLFSTEQYRVLLLFTKPSENISELCLLISKDAKSKKTQIALNILESC